MSSLRWLSSLWKGYQAELDALDERIKQPLSRVKALKSSTRESDMAEREKLRRWLEDGMKERSRLEELSGEAGNALLTFSRLWSLPDAMLLGKNRERGLEAQMRVLEEQRGRLQPDPDRMDEWWEAHQRVQRDLFAMAIEEERQKSEHGDRGSQRDLDELADLLRNLLDRLSSVDREERVSLEETGIITLLRQFIVVVRPLLNDDQGDES